MDDSSSLWTMDHHRWMKIMDNGLPHSYPSLIAFLAGALVSQETTPRKKLCVSDHVPSRGFCFPGKRTPKKSYAFLVAFLAGAFVFQGNTPWKSAMRL